jgi:hypothetical protein
MNRQAGYVGIDRTTAGGSGGSGIFTMDALYRARLSNTWSTEFSTWDYNAMGSSKWNLNGTWGTNSSTVLAQSGASYPTFVQAISTSSFKALNASWQIDFQFNKTGYNSSPYPGQLFAITQSDDPATAGNSLNETTGDLLVDMYSGNNYSFELHIKDTAGTTIYTNELNNSNYATAGHPIRLNFDHPTGVFTWKASTSTSTADFVTLGTYTLTTAQRNVLFTTANRNKEYFLGAKGRGGEDGVRNLTWVTT